MNKVEKFIPPHPLKTAVLFLVFNRLDTTKQVFEAIRQAKPPRIYIAADGARVDKEGETEKVQAVRDYVMANIDWECDVKTLFREQNLGCKYAVSGAITWFFDQEEQGIILEDDCLPSQSFFWFCEALLEKYNNDDSVYSISGDGRATTNISMVGDYAFTKYALVWGWASWARVWRKYDVEILDWPEQKKDVINNISRHKDTKRYWRVTLSKLFDRKINTWDYQLSYLLLSNHAHCILPSVNLITNIGFGSEATHTVDINSNCANVPNYEINFPLEHKMAIFDEQQVNDFLDLNVFSKKSLFKKAANKLISIIK
jgi:hypothetical protein